MKIQLIRNATMKISLAGKTILTDPMLLPKHGIDSFAGNERNPVVDLPFSVEEILKGVDMVLVSHVHRDHFDDGAKQMLPRDIPILCPMEYKGEIGEAGFSNLTPVDEVLDWEGIKIKRTEGQHAGSEKWQKILGPVSGFLLKAEDEPSLYWPGDTILIPEVERIIREEAPDIILPHACAAVLEDSGPIVMDGQMVINICRLAPKARVTAIHMEALDHATLDRKGLRAMAEAEGIDAGQLLIPEDGESLSFEKEAK